MTMLLQRTAPLRLLQKQLVRSRRASTAAAYILSQQQQQWRRLGAPALAAHATLASSHPNHYHLQLRQQQQVSLTRTLCSSATPTAANSSSNDSNDAPITPKSPKDELFLRALRTYYEREGHFSVPNEFVIPTPSESESTDSDDDTIKPAWPQDTYGMDLGRRLRLFTRGRCGEYKRAVLKGIGFPYDDWRTYVWEQQILPALRTFETIEGHLFVRQAFEVPHGDSRWPRSTWGFKLGSHCQLLRREKERTLLPQQIQELDAIGFMWSEHEWKRKVFLLPSLTAFRERFGHSDVPDKFVVPSDDPRWPVKTWGYRLGRMVALVREELEAGHAIPAAHKRDLDALAFFDSATEALSVWRTRVLPALETFVAVYSHTAVPPTFVVPSDDALWPEPTRGLELGDVVYHINNSALFSTALAVDKQQLQALGYRWDALYGRWSKQLLPALQQFYRLYDHCDVPQMFIVPMNDATWPPETWGFRLGKQVSLLRRSGRDARDVAEVLTALDAMGFSFNVLESAFVEKVLPALEVYAAQHGDCNVPQGFVVPSDDAWPKRAWGIKLGHIIRNIRGRKQHAEQVDAHRERLIELGFVWRLNQNVEATNRDVVKPYLSVFESIYGTTDVPREFVIPHDDPRWPDAAHGFKLGDWLHRYHQRDAGLLPFQTKEGRVANQKRQRPKATATTGSIGLSPFQDAYWREVLLAAFDAYATLYGSCVDMPSGFVVPSEAPFPQPAWGLNLGLRLRHVRHGERYADEVIKYRDDLERLGVLEPVVDDEEADEDEEEADEDEEEADETGIETDSEDDREDDGSDRM